MSDTRCIQQRIGQQLFMKQVTKDPRVKLRCEKKLRKLRVLLKRAKFKEMLLCQ